MHSDQQLFNEGSTDSLVNAYSTNSESFLTDFANAMVKMGELSPLTGTSGQIRTNCNKANWVKALEFAVWVSMYSHCSSLFCGWADNIKKIRALLLV